MCVFEYCMYVHVHVHRLMKMVIKRINNNDMFTFCFFLFFSSATQDLYIRLRSFFL